MDYRMPLYIQLQDIILKKIEEKKYLPGEMIPSERKMAEIYGVNRMTVKRAINKLVEEGYLYRELGVGTFVAKRDNKKIDIDYQNETGNSGISAIFRERGIKISNRILGMGDITGSKFINYKLGQAETEIIWGLHRVRFGDNMPFAIEYTYVPKKYFDDIDNFDFSKVSLYDYMEANGHLPTHFIQNLIICSANEKIADLLNVKKGSAVFRIEYQASDKDYNLVEYTKSYLNPEFAEFRFVAEAE
ncbi:GntR family transcriptional regulator [bacterium D16-51]|nr:GntR family transcriptional regulator [bacterium D16-59]RKI62079.1 GntR family transcriptional regulator [bacterium D16-51]